MDKKNLQIHFYHLFFIISDPEQSTDTMHLI